MDESRQAHWDDVYATKAPQELSWTQAVPQTSLDFIRGFRLPPDAAIIDVGGGDSRLVGHLLDEGYRNLTVLDISERAIDRARRQLDGRADRVRWLVCDVTRFRPTETYDCWHDRAAFHFLTRGDEVDSYLATARQSVRGYMVVGTFSDKGPTRCSRLDIRQYSEPQLQERLGDGFEKIRCLTEDHVTPFGTRQQFLFCSFRRTAG